MCARLMVLSLTVAMIRAWYGSSPRLDGGRACRRGTRATTPSTLGPGLWPSPRAYLRQQPVARRQQSEPNTNHRVTVAGSERVTPTIAAMSDTELMYGRALMACRRLMGTSTPGDDP
jgi:hypothetical protein